jgi:hypothetical protein
MNFLSAVKVWLTRDVFAAPHKQPDADRQEPQLHDRGTEEGHGACVSTE